MTMTDKISDVIYACLCPKEKEKADGVWSDVCFLDPLEKTHRFIRQDSIADIAGLDDAIKIVQDYYDWMKGDYTTRHHSNEKLSKSF